MRAAFMYGAGDVRVEEAADPKLEQPTDALARISPFAWSDKHVVTTTTMRVEPR